MEKNLENLTRSERIRSFIGNKFAPVFAGLAALAMVAIGIKYEIDISKIRAEFRTKYESVLAPYKNNPTPENAWLVQRPLYNVVANTIGKYDYSNDKVNGEYYLLPSHWQAAFKKAKIDYHGSMPPGPADLSVPQLMKLCEKYVLK